MSTDLRFMSQLSAEEKTEVCQLYQQGDKLQDIAAAYQLKDPAQISHLAREAGLPPRRVTAPRGADVERELVDIDKELAELNRRKAELEAKREARQINFEWADDTTIIVRGVTSTFVQNEGMARLLRFIEKATPQRKIGGV